MPVRPSHCNMMVMIHVNRLGRYLIVNTMDHLPIIYPNLTVRYEQETLTISNDLSHVMIRSHKLTPQWCSLYLYTMYIPATLHLGLPIYNSTFWTLWFPPKDIQALTALWNGTWFVHMYVNVCIHSLIICMDINGFGAMNSCLSHV